MLLTEAKDIYVHNRPCPGIDSILKQSYHRNTDSSDAKYVAFKEELDSLSGLNRIKSLKGRMLHIEAPSFTPKDLNGADVSLRSLKGKVVVLDFCKNRVIGFGDY